FVLGARVYVPNGNNDQVECYDYSTQATCANFPKSFQNLSLLYTVNPDPQRPTCIWVNADSGSGQIQNFDAYTAGGCGQGPIRVLASSVVVPTQVCMPTQYTSLQVIAPARNTYTSGTVAFLDANGNPIPGVADRPIDNTGTVDLTGLNLSPSNGLPQFLITLVGEQGTPGSVQVKLTWTGTDDPSCVKPGTQVTHGQAPAPALTAVNPASGPEAGGTTVVLTGTDLTGATAVSFGPTAATSFTVDSPTQITATAPPGTGTVDVSVTTPGGTSPTGSADRYTYTPPPPPTGGTPVVTSVAPASGPTTGGTGVVVFGAHLDGATIVRFGGAVGTVLGVSADGTQLVALSPPGSGTVDVSVTTPAGRSPTSAGDQFTYTRADPGATTGGATTGGATTGGATTGGTTGGGTTGGTAGGAKSTNPPAGHPTTVTGPPKVISSSSAQFTATINPGGLPTTMHFDYTVELPGGASAAAITYDARTPEQPVGSDFADHTVTATVASLLPNSTYHVRAVAANSAGVAPSPDATFKTAADPPPPPPVLGKAVNAQAVSGIVYVLLPGSGHVSQAHA
ncbi:MAG: IPT/TIG domain-containing protein, partial [Actinobacteria bacterium]|nr:IPT/TIG domain-containing protein [Actinomycetota bacterium]